MTKITVDYIKDNFEYDPETGVIRNRDTGKPVGYLWTNEEQGYMKVSIREGAVVKKLQASRVIHVLMTGEYPHYSVVVRYRDGNPSNLKWANLVFMDRAELNKNLERVDRPSYVVTNDPHVFRGVHNGVYVVRRWEPGEGSSLAVLRFNSFEDACVAAQEWRASRIVSAP